MFKNTWEYNEASEQGFNYKQEVLSASSLFINSSSFVCLRSRVIFHQLLGKVNLQITATASEHGSERCVFNDTRRRLWLWLRNEVSGKPLRNGFVTVNRCRTGWITRVSAVHSTAYTHRGKSSWRCFELSISDWTGLTFHSVESVEFFCFKYTHHFFSLRLQRWLITCCVLVSLWSKTDNTVPPFRFFFFRKRLNPDVLINLWWYLCHHYSS